MYATDTQTDVRRQTKASLNASALWGRRYNKQVGMDASRDKNTAGVKKEDTLLLSINSPTIDRFSFYFH